MKAKLGTLAPFSQRRRYRTPTFRLDTSIPATRDFDRPFPLNCGRSLAKAAGYSHQTSTWNSFPNPLCFYSILDYIGSFQDHSLTSFFGYCSQLKIPAIGDETRRQKRISTRIVWVSVSSNGLERKQMANIGNTTIFMNYISMWVCTVHVYDLHTVCTCNSDSRFQWSTNDGSILQGLG